MDLPQHWPAISIDDAHARLTAHGARFEMETVAIRGVPTRVWKNAPKTLRDVLEHLRTYSERTCLVSGDERVSYQDFVRATSALSHALLELGVQRGDRVALIMRNLPEWPVWLFATTAIGAIATPCNAWSSGPELEHALRHSGAVLACVDGERLTRLAPHLEACSALRTLCLTRADAEVSVPARIRCASLEQILGNVRDWGRLSERALPEAQLAPDDDALIFYTSGTTGKPKGAVVTHRNACANTLTTACAQARAYLRRGQEPPLPNPRAPQRSMLLAVPMFHVMGCMPWLIAGLHGGAKLVLMHKWDAGRALALIEQERITQAGGVPTMAWQLLDHPARAQHDLSSLESLTYGGAPAAPELVRRLREAFPQVRASNGWGMTEVTSSYASNGAEDYLARPGSCGVAAPTNDWKIMSEDGRQELPRGQAGELWVKGPQVVRGYWDDAEATAQSFQDGWLKTGDIAYLDDEGFCYLVDRAKDMLIRGGENIYCVEVENALHEHPAVLDAAVVGAAHPQLGEEPLAIVQLRPGHVLAEDALRTFVRERLAPFKVPVRVLWSEEPLPRNAAGKLLKQELRRRVLGGQFA
jgi:long-chain acyl-CoA synthetase